ncbi:HD domain-containing protein [archaeon]|nr:HD domain-containing protein [archaeon]
MNNQKQQDVNFSKNKEIDLIAVKSHEKEIDPIRKALANEKYSKLGIQLKGYLKGKGFHNALEAFDFAKKHHTGMRKDGYTPEFQHQIEICLFIMTLKEIRDEQNTYVAAILHDVREDYDIPYEVIESKFGKVAADVVENLTKVFKGTKKDTQEYFNQIAECPISSIVKLADRINNVSSMVGVFTIKKQEDYIFEIKEYFFPLLKKVRGRFPDQSLSYYGMGTFLKNMSNTVEAVLISEKKMIENIDCKTKVIKPKM